MPSGRAVRGTRRADHRPRASLAAILAVAVLILAGAGAGASARPGLQTAWAAGDLAFLALEGVVPAAWSPAPATAVSESEGLVGVWLVAGHTSGAAGGTADSARLLGAARSWASGTHVLSGALSPAASLDRLTLLVWLSRAFHFRGRARMPYTDQGLVPTSDRVAVGADLANGVAFPAPATLLEPSRPVSRAELAGLLVDAEQAAVARLGGARRATWSPPACLPGPPGAGCVHVPAWTGTGRVATASLGGRRLTGGEVSLSTAFKSLHLGLTARFVQFSGFLAVSVTNVAAKAGTGSESGQAWYEGSAGAAQGRLAVYSLPPAPLGATQVVQVPLRQVVTYAVAASGLVTYRASAHGSGISMSASGGFLLRSASGGGLTAYNCVGATAGSCGPREGAFVGPGLPVGALVALESTIMIEVGVEALVLSPSSQPSG